MTEQLNMHTDPSGLLESLKAASGDRPYLGDPQAVERLIRQFASQVLERYDEVGHGVLTPSDASAADAAACQHMAAIFLGAEEGYAPVREWTGAPLAQHLRDRMQRDLVAEEDDRSVVAQAFAVLVHRLYDVLRQSDAPQDAVLADVEASVRSLAMALVGVVGND